LQAHAAKGPLPKQVEYLLHRGGVSVVKGDTDAGTGEDSGKNQLASRISRNAEVLVGREGGREGGMEGWMEGERVC
jgi:hypothetical protein